ncbi:phosphoribosyl-ATP diphosphatase, partial [uncultured Clostridium sp.]|uniref:phosphoribosyl-ATP diphosphatase n=1 Tax=uncultured Clostridium sp. TaxID=59620 RepID=UPI00272E59FF
MVLDDLYEIIKERKNNGEEGSYTRYLFEKGTDKILKKVGEDESVEVGVFAVPCGHLAGVAAEGDCSVGRGDGGDGLGG